ncbi:MAG: hypothetical protein HRT87_03950 [Legionellales bacterium]|nr:hypothetical protein [Legionellales bacterium]
MKNTETTKTHWKKNNDSTYISGEDLKGELNGLKKDSPVIISRFENGLTYDQNNNEKVTKTVLFFTDEQGKALYKGVVLNNTAAKFFVGEFGSPYVDDWVGKKCNMFAQADKRHGFVVRFKKYFKPPINLEGAKLALNSADSLKGLSSAWSTLSQEEQGNAQIIKLKDELKTKLS